MIEHVLELMEHLAGAISVFAAGVIVVGFALAVGRYIVRVGKTTLDDDFSRFKIEQGHSLTLGLEILVLGDLIETITVEPTVQSLVVLAFLVVLRTIVSWSLTLEIEGHWPWQESQEESGGAV